MKKKDLLLKVKADIKMVKDEAKTIYKIVSNDIYTNSQLDEAMREINNAKFRLNRIETIYSEMHEKNNTTTEIPEP